MPVFVLYLHLLLFLLFAKKVPSAPVCDLTDRDWYIFSEVLGNISKTLSHNITPAIAKFDSEENVLSSITTLKEKIGKVLYDEAARQMDFWTDVKSFFIKEVHNFTKLIADDYNPLPSISHAIDNVKQSSTWVSIISFFNEYYDRLAGMSENIFDELLKTFDEGNMMRERKKKMYRNFIS